MVHFREACQQGTVGKHCVGQKILHVDKMFGRNLILSDKIMEPDLNIPQYRGPM